MPQAIFFDTLTFLRKYKSKETGKLSVPVY